MLLISSKICENQSSPVIPSGIILYLSWKYMSLNARKKTHADKVLCSSCKVPFILVHSQTYKRSRPWWQNAGRGVSGKSLEQKKRYSQSSLFFKQSALHYRLIRPKHTSVVDHGGKCKMWIFRKIPWMEEKIQLRRYFILQVKCPSLAINCDWNGKCCSPWWVNARYGISGKSLEWEKRYSWEGTLYFK